MAPVFDQFLLQRLRFRLVFLERLTHRFLLTAKSGTASRLATEKERTNSEKIQELYLTAMSREPTPQEMTIATNYLEKHKADPKRGFEDVVWALMLTKEFLFNH